jgi:hypothetical protein
MVCVATHLEECDFCGAELQLLTEHAPAEVQECSLTAMPPHLRWLAESLLSTSLLNLEALVEPIHEKERLTLTDA